MAEAALWGLIGASSLLIGAVIGVTAKDRLTLPVVGILLAFGAGTLVSAVAFELTEEAYSLGGADVVAIGLAAGGLAYYAGTVAISIHGGANRMGASERADTDSSSALLLGAILDGIPESIVIGITLLAGGEVGIPFLIAVFLSNLPESISSSRGMCEQGVSLWTVLRRWGLVALASAAAAALGYAALENAGEEPIGLIQAFAGGAVLTMLADNMFPEAYLNIRNRAGLLGERNPNPWLEHAIGLLTTLGFAVAYLLSTLD